MIKRNSQSGAALLDAVKMIGLLGVALLLVAFIFGTVVPPGQMGVRLITVQLPLGPKAGIGEEALKPGYHWNIPFYSRIIFVPQHTQLLHLHRASEPGEIDSAVEVQTTDGSSVVVDISVLSRFYDEPGVERYDGIELSHGGPSELLRELGSSELQWINTIRKDAVDELKRAMSSLSTSDFYNPHKREERLKVALLSLNQKMAPRGIRILDVLLRRYTYSEERIDKAIFAKNLQDQEERLNTAAGKLAEAKATLERNAAELDAKITTLQVQGENSAKVLRSQGDLYEAQKRAEGDLLVARAMAEVDRLKAGAFSNEQAAQIYVARELAPLVGSLKGGVVGGIDPYNVEDWMKRFGLEGR